MRFESECDLNSKEVMSRHLNLFCRACAVFTLALFIGCSQKPESSVSRLAPFTVTNVVVGGERRQILEMTNGMSLYFTSTNAVIWFGEDSSVAVEFDPKSLRTAQNPAIHATLA
jgi:hypothetical protein